MNRFNQREYSRFKNSLVATYLSYCDFYRFVLIRGGAKKIFFLLSVKRGGLGQSKKSLSENTQIFCDHFGLKTEFFLPFFSFRGVGLAQSKKSLSEKTDVVKKGGGGVSVFFY